MQHIDTNTLALRGEENLHLMSSLLSQPRRSAAPSDLHLRYVTAHLHSFFLTFATSGKSGHQSFSSSRKSGWQLFGSSRKSGQHSFSSSGKPSRHPFSLSRKPSRCPCTTSGNSG